MLSNAHAMLYLSIDYWVTFNTASRLPRILLQPFSGETKKNRWSKRQAKIARERERGREGGIESQRQLRWTVKTPIGNCGTEKEKSLGTRHGAKVPTKQEPERARERPL
jgi:hypothetical protein